jgi:tetratricopeptide (TPR) repeat protein
VRDTSAHACFASCDQPLAWIISALSLLIATLVCCGTGCRALHGKMSDDSIAAARSLSLQGMDAQQKGNWEQAELLYASAVSKCPTDERAHCGFAESLWRRGAQHEAIQHMEQAVRLSGDDPERQIQLGRMYLARNEYQPAAAAAEKAIAANKHLPAAWALRGDVQRALGDRTQALASYHRALSVQEHFPEVQTALAEIYSQQNRPQRALATLQSLADRYSPGQTPTDVLYREGLVLRQLGRYQDAAQYLVRATSRGEPTADMLYELGRTQLLAGDTTAANFTCVAALQANPQHAGSQALKAELDTQRHRMSAAVNLR